MAYAGPESNVRVEHMSHDCFNDGGALAEVMSLYENMDDDHSKSNGHHDQIDESKERNDLHGIEVRPAVLVFYRSAFIALVQRDYNGRICH